MPGLPALGTFRAGSSWWSELFCKTGTGNRRIQQSLPAPADFREAGPGRRRCGPWPVAVTPASHLGLAGVSAIAAGSYEALTGSRRVFGERCAVPEDPGRPRSKVFPQLRIVGSLQLSRLAVRWPTPERSSHRRSSDLVELFDEP